MATIAETWLERGREEGREKLTWDVVRNSLKAGLPINTIEKITGLSADKINRLKAKMSREEKKAANQTH